MDITNPYEISNEKMKVSLKYMDQSQEVSYSLSVRDGDGWKEISNQQSLLVKGSSFKLRTEQIAVDEATSEASKEALLLYGTAEAKDCNGVIMQYKWNGSVKCEKNTGWFRFRLELHLLDDIQLQMVDGYEPEIILQLGELPPYERGDHVWFKTAISGPTKWNDDAYGNDIPAVYYYDNYKKYQIMMFFNMTDMAWMSKDNIARFLNYRCGIRRTYTDKPRLEMGLMADSASGNRINKGTAVFEYYIKAEPRIALVTEQEATRLLTEECMKLLPSRQPWPPRATDWSGFSHRCAMDLMDEKACWSTYDGCEYLISYVNGYSPAWREVQEARGAKGGSFYEGYDFCVSVWTLYPLLLLKRYTDNGIYSSLAEKVFKLIRYVTKYRDEKKLIFGGTVGSWQYLSMLHDLFKVGLYGGHKEAVDRVMEEVEKAIIPFAEKTGYLFPLSFNTKTLRKEGGGDNYSVAGLFAALMLELYDFTKDKSYLEHAKKAILVLYNLPAGSILQESLLLSYGVQASCKIYSINQDETYMEAAQYFIAQNLRLAYWYNDKTKQQYENYNILGMFQACTPMLYPAFFENMLCLPLLSFSLRHKAPKKEFLRFFNLGRINNFYMFPECLPKEYQLSHLKYIPLENLGLLEDDKTGYVGQEIYGVCGVFWGHLLWEAFAKCDNKEIMIMNLDLFDQNQMGMLDKNLLFIIYNPLEGKETVKVNFATVKAGDAVLLCKDPDEAGKPLEMDADGVCITIGPEEYFYIKLHRK